MSLDYIFSSNTIPIVEVTPSPVEQSNQLFPIEKSCGELFCICEEFVNTPRANFIARISRPLDPIDLSTKFIVSPATVMLNNICFLANFVTSVCCVVHTVYIHVFASS